jgi:hypothetical protein
MTLRFASVMGALPIPVARADLSRGSREFAVTGQVCSSDQPGIAASVFGGAQVRILSFDGGQLVSRPRTSSHNSRAEHPASRRCSSLTYAR